MKSSHTRIASKPIPGGETSAATNRRFLGSHQFLTELLTAPEPRTARGGGLAGSEPEGVAQVANLPYRRLPACEGNPRFIGRGGWKRITFLLGFLLGIVGGLPRTFAATAMEQGFSAPPPQARPWVYWYFMDGNRTREGMTADLEAMRDAGIGGAIYLEVDIGVPRGPVPFMSPEWRALFVHAVREAERCGIELALGTGPGWCGTGGPWITADQSMQHLVASETRVTGPRRFEGILERPQPRKPFFGEGTLTPELARAWREYYRDEVVLAFPTPRGEGRIARLDEKALYQRAPYSSQRGVVSALPMPAEHREVEPAARIPQGTVQDLSGHLAPDGRLRWEVPAGEWTILRFGRTATGQSTRPAPLPGLGFESDKFQPVAVDAHLERFVGVLLRDIGERKPGVGGLTTLHFDSWEMSSQNWTEGFRELFRRHRGYDPLPYLPAYTGAVVEGVEQTERFLWDVRQTAQELVVTNHVQRLRDYAHRHGMRFSSEPYDMNPCADLTLGSAADVPMGEFWWLGFDAFHTVLEAASIAHTEGREIVAAESFTSDAGEDWRAHPGNLKAMGDWAFAAGVNRIAFHRYQHQPWRDREPGMRMGIYGVHWERTQTWWPMVLAYHTYLARCQHLLRQGRTVADILYLTPEGAPHVFRAPADATVGEPPDRRGYNFDGCSPDTLIRRARVEAGRIVFPGGSSYRVLVLPNEATMTPGLLGKIAALARAGALVVGPPPRKSPSLSGYPGCDDEVRALAAELWREDLPQIRWRPAWASSESGAPTPTASMAPGPDRSTHYVAYDVLADELRAEGVPADFEADGPIRYTHRTTDAVELYFVSNRSGERVEVTGWFRVEGRAPELWHPVDGRRRPLTPQRVDGGRMALRLRFEPHESYFVVFSPVEPSKPRTEPRGVDFPDWRTVRAVSGPWEVGFEPRWGAPERVVFQGLVDWSQHPELSIRHYSGRATYRTTLEVSEAEVRSFAARGLALDLGVVHNLARVRVNGREGGVVWCSPWRVEVATLLKPGTNVLEITVANLWPNRLIGDAGLPPEKRRTWTTSNPYRADAKLLPSGLLGPVTLTTPAVAASIP